MADKIYAVIDTNVIVSTLIWKVQVNGYRRDTERVSSGICKDP